MLTALTHFASGYNAGEIQNHKLKPSKSKLESQDWDHVETIRKDVTPTSESILSITQAALLLLLATHPEIHFCEKDEMSRTKFEIKTDSKQVRSEAFPREKVHSNRDPTASACVATTPGYQVTNGLKLVPNQVNFKGHLNQLPYFKSM